MRPSVVPDMQRKAACEAADCFRTTNPRVKSLTDAIWPVLLPQHGPLLRNGTRAGLEGVRQLGRKGGRKPRMTGSKIESARKLLASGVRPRDVARNLAISVPTLYRWVPASAHTRI